MLWLFAFKYALIWNIGSDGSTERNKYVIAALERTWKSYLPSPSLASSPAFKFLKIFKGDVITFLYDIACMLRCVLNLEFKRVEHPMSQKPQPCKGKLTFHSPVLLL